MLTSLSSMLVSLPPLTAVAAAALLVLVAVVLRWRRVAGPRPGEAVPVLAAIGTDTPPTEASAAWFQDMVRGFLKAWFAGCAWRGPPLARTAHAAMQSVWRARGEAAYRTCSARTRKWMALSAGTRAERW
jgi:hypothetical protein